MALSVGRFRVHQVLDGTVAFDGGAMFGVVPRALWERQFPPDERNRVIFALRCMLIVDGERRILVDNGIGGRWDGRHRDMYGLEAARTLEDQLKKAGFSREDITDVVLTHLHFDHAGGTTSETHGGSALAFPNATYHLQRRHWRWAHHPNHQGKRDEERPIEVPSTRHQCESLEIIAVDDTIDEIVVGTGKPRESELERGSLPAP